MAVNMETKVTQKGRFTISGTSTPSPELRRPQGASAPGKLGKSVSSPPAVMSHHASYTTTRPVSRTESLILPATQSCPSTHKSAVQLSHNRVEVDTPDQGALTRGTSLDLPSPYVTRAEPKPKSVPFLPSGPVFSKVNLCDGTEPNSPPPPAAPTAFFFDRALSGPPKQTMKHGRSFDSATPQSFLMHKTANPVDEKAMRTLPVSKPTSHYSLPPVREQARWCGQNTSKEVNSMTSNQPGGREQGTSGQNFHQIGRFHLSSLNSATSPGDRSPMGTVYATVHTSKPATTSVPLAHLMKEAMGNHDHGVARAALNIDLQTLHYRLQEVLTNDQLRQLFSENILSPEPPKKENVTPISPTNLHCNCPPAHTQARKQRSAPTLHPLDCIPARRTESLTSPRPQEASNGNEPKSPSFGITQSINGKRSRPSSASAASTGRDANKSIDMNMLLNQTPANYGPCDRFSDVDQYDVWLNRRSERKGACYCERSVKPPRLYYNSCGDVTFSQGCDVDHESSLNPHLRDHSQPHNMRLDESASGLSGSASGIDNKGAILQEILIQVTELRRQQESLAASQLDFKQWVQCTLTSQSQHIELMERLLTGTKDSCAFNRPEDVDQPHTPMVSTPSTCSSCSSMPPLSPNVASTSNLSNKGTAPMKTLTKPTSAGRFSVYSTTNNVITQKTQQQTASKEDILHTPHKPSGGDGVVCPNRECKCQYHSLKSGILGPGMIPSPAPITQRLPPIEYSQTPMGIHERQLEDLQKMCIEHSKTTQLMLSRVVRLAGGMDCANPEEMMDTITLLDIRNESLTLENAALKQKLSTLEQPRSKSDGLGTS